MNTIISIFRWTLGIILCFGSLGGFAAGETVQAFIVMTVGLLLLPPVSKAFLKKKENNKGLLNDEEQSRKKFKSALSTIQFPDRIEAIIWHTKAIEKALGIGDIDLANMSYAKLIESIRQQNENKKGKYDEYLEAVRQEYDHFRNFYKFEYPTHFLPPSQRNKGNRGQDNTSTFIDTNSKVLREEQIEEIGGFYGTVEYSRNNKFCILFRDGHWVDNKWKKGDLALIQGKKLLFKRKVERPNDCHVSDNGTVICCDWMKTEELSGKFLIFDSLGEEIFMLKTSANLGSSGISHDGKIAIFETHSSDTEDGDKLFLIDIEEKQLINRFEAKCSFNNVEIDTTRRRIKLLSRRHFLFEIDYKGNQTNKEDFENQILKNGSIMDKLWLYNQNPDKEKGIEYLRLLNLALTDSDACYSYGKDKLYRMLGEYFEFKGESMKAIESWEKALAINPKVGIKRRLDILKKKNLE